MRREVAEIFKEVLRLTSNERFTAGGMINLVGLVISGVLLSLVFAVHVVVLIVRSVNVDVGPVHLVAANDPAIDVLAVLIMFVLFLLYAISCAYMYDGYTLIRRSRRRPPQ